MYVTIHIHTCTHIDVWTTWICHLSIITEIFCLLWMFTVIPVLQSCGTVFPCTLLWSLNTLLMKFPHTWQSSCVYHWHLAVCFRELGCPSFIVSVYGLDDWRMQFPPLANYFLHSIQIGSGTHPSSCLMGIGSKAFRAWNDLSPLNVRVKNVWTYSSTSRRHDVVLNRAHRQQFDSVFFTCDSTKSSHSTAVTPIMFSDIF
jgi:hypothetical protein